MKKFVLSMIALIAMGDAAMGQKVSVADVEALPGETVAFSVNLSEGKADTYTAMTLNVLFLAEGFTTTGKYTVSEAWEGVSAVVGDVDATGLAKIPFASANAIAGAEVEGLVTISFKVDESVAVGQYTVTLKETLFEYNSSDKDIADDATFTVNVVSRHNVTLDENATEAPAAAEGVNVTVKRTINAGEWSTVCLPFAMTEAQVKAAFGDDVQLGDFQGCEQDEETEKVNVKFADATAIEANHPYIIKVAAAVSEFSVEGVDIAPEDEPMVQKDKSKKNYNSFIGNYVNGTTVDDYGLYLNGGKFWYSMGGAKMKAFRGYFVFDSVDVDYESSSRMVITFGEATGIDTVTSEELKVKSYYNLSGLRVGQPAKGLYIVNGKKLIVK